MGKRDNIFEIATFNVNSIRSRIYIIKKWLEKTRVNVLCMQETKVADELFPKDEFEEIGYNVIFRGEKRYNGVAIASLSSFEKTEFGFKKEPFEDTRFIKTVIRGIPILNTYIPQGKSIEHSDYVYKLKWMDRLMEYIEENFSPEQPLILTGDMNVAPTDIDVTNPETKKKHVCFHTDIKKKFYNLLEWGFVDIFRKYHPEPGHFTFFDYRVKDALKRNIGWRVDHILVTKPLAEKSIDSYIDKEPREWDKPSDHTPLVAEFSL